MSLTVSFVISITRTFQLLSGTVLLLAAASRPAWSGNLALIGAEFAGAVSLIVAAPGNPAIDNAPFLTPRNTGFDGVAGLILHRSDGTLLCTGSRVSATWVLTAAHCLADGTGTMVTTSVDAVFFPSAGGTVALTASGGANLLINPLYDGQVISDYDIALVHLPGSPGPGVDIYNLYGGPVTTNPFTIVGFGLRGDGSSGATLPSGSRRRGFNRFDFFESSGVLVSDFDNGNPMNDAACYLESTLCDATGLGQFESNTAPGDSGGPVFFGNQIVAVTSFGASMGSPPDVNNALDSSFGEFSGYTYVGFNREFITSNAIPEPATCGLLALGLGALAWQRRRRGTPSSPFRS